MIDLINRIGNVVRSVTSKPWFWILLAVIAVLWIVVTVYRKLKTRALGRLEYTRAFSTD